LDNNVLNSEQLQKIVGQIDQAIVSDNDWHVELMRSIICKSSTEEQLVNAKKYSACNFGLWFYSDDNQLPKTHPKFNALENAHKLVHEKAAMLLQESQSQDIISPLTYDGFADAVEQMRCVLTELKQEFENLLYDHDTLTGAETRMCLLPKLKQQQELMQRGIQPDCCIAMLDLDNFKKINDGLGHLVGDEVLRTVIKYVIQQLRSYDMVFRYGGEEFIICMPHTNLETASCLIERLRSGIEFLPIKIEANTIIHVTASFGLAKLIANSPIVDVIDCADKAMYKAKASGKNCMFIGN
jgi:diguanylate cyclase